VIVELRRYLLEPGRRDELIELFDRELVEPQEELGMAVLGQFRDLDRPDVFTWLRGFPDMTVRLEGLTAFYSGPVWKRHGPAANATMIDSDDVLLLREVVPVPVADRATPPGDGLLFATVWYGAGPLGDDVLGRVPTSALAVLRTEYAENTFPALPVRADEHAIVWFSRSDEPGDPPAGVVRAERLRLTPTARSALR
jgi:hypothetical protein